MTHPRSMPKNEDIVWLPPIDIIVDVDKPSGPHGDKFTTGSGGGSGDDSGHADHGSGGAVSSDSVNVYTKLKSQRTKLLATGDNAQYCNKFLIAYSRLYASLLGRPEAALPNLKANELIAQLEKGKTFLKLDTNGKAAKAHADRGEFVIAGLPGSTQGHVMLVTEGPGKVLGKEKKFYPSVLGGGRDEGYSSGNKTAGDTWNTTDRPNVRYYVLKPRPEPKPEPLPEK